MVGNGQRKRQRLYSPLEDPCAEFVHVQEVIEAVRAAYADLTASDKLLLQLFSGYRYGTIYPLTVIGLYYNLSLQGIHERYDRAVMHFHRSLSKNLGYYLSFYSQEDSGGVLAALGVQKMGSLRPVTVNDLRQSLYGRIITEQDAGGYLAQISSTESQFRREENRNSYPQFISYSHASQYPNRCVVCGNVIVGESFSRLCSYCKQNASYNEKQRGYHRAVSNQNARRINSTDRCALCGEPYRVESGDQKFCSLCSQEFVRTKGIRQRNHGSMYGYCGICGNLFERTSQHRSYCSEECSAKRNTRGKRQNEDL